MAVATLAAMPAPAARADRYTLPAIGLHWLLALMVLGAIGVGAYMSGLPLSPARLKIVNWHKWAGISILVLTLARLAWRAGHRPPPPVAMPAWQARAAHATHWLMYALCIVVPLVGWAYSSAAGFPVVWFGVLPLPDFVRADKALAEAIKPWHGALARLLLALVVLHLAAALKHHFIDRDRLLWRMWP